MRWTKSSLDITMADGHRIIPGPDFGDGRAIVQETVLPAVYPTMIVNLGLFCPELCPITDA
jgi:hypothetical protein